MTEAPLVVVVGQQDRRAGLGSGAASVVEGETDAVEDDAGLLEGHPGVGCCGRGFGRGLPEVARVLDGGQTPCDHDDRAHSGGDL